MPLLQTSEPLDFEELSIVFLSEKRMAEINWQHLSHEGPTDVITYQHGEILICPAVAESAARDHGETLRKELLLYVIHGWLHLAGWDDKSTAPAQRMAKRQEALLQQFLSEK